MKNRTIVNDEALIYRKVEDTIHAYTNIFCYPFIKGDIDSKIDGLYKINSDNNKFYTIDEEKNIFKGFVIGEKGDLIAAENISLVVNILKELGFDPIIKLKLKEDTALITYLDYLLLDYEIISQDSCDYDNYSYVIEENNSVICTGGNIENKHVFELDLFMLIDLLRDDFEKISDLDVFIVADTSETELKANMLLQDLRLNNVKTAICYENLDSKEQQKLADLKGAHQLIFLSDEDLQKGLIKVEDNLTKESKKIPEDEILDYILSLL